LKTFFYLAKRLLISGKRFTAVSVISWIAILGMMVSSAAMVILLSAFNGIEKMIEDLYSSFDQEIMITPIHGRKMMSNDAAKIQQQIKKISGVKNTSIFIQERVIVRNKKKWSNAELWAVDSVFFDMANTRNKKHLINGHFKGANSMFIGVGLANRLMMLSMELTSQPIVLYYPKQDKKIKFGQTPFYQQVLSIDGALEYNKEVNDNVLLVPLNSVEKYLQNRVSGILVSTNPENKDEIKRAIELICPKTLGVKTNLEKNELIFKTSRSEKLIVIVILLFVFILSLFNLAAAITMTYIEKKNGVVALFTLGMSAFDIRTLYFILGCLIVLIGVGAGIVLGIAIVSVHESIGLLRLPGAVTFFPSRISIAQVFFFSFLLFILGTAVSWATSTFLVKPKRKASVNFRAE